MRFPTMWYVRPAKAKTSLCIRAVWSESLQVAWIFYDCLAPGRTALKVSELNRRLRMLVWVCLYENATLLEITCHGSIIIGIHRLCVISRWSIICRLKRLIDKSCLLEKAVGIDNCSSGILPCKWSVTSAPLLNNCIGNAAFNNSTWLYAAFLSINPRRRHLNGIKEWT